MKYIKTLEETSYNHYPKIYQSGTFSKNDDNIVDLFNNIYVLERLEIDYEIFKFTEPVIYFKLYIFPKDLDQYIYLNNKKYTFSAIYNSKLVDVNDLKNHFGNYVEHLNKNITKDDIDIIYQTQKYNL